MKYGWMGILVLVLTVGVDAQITKVATFDNFTAGQSFQTSFTDPLSGVTFTNSTHPFAGGFDIDGDPDREFLGSNYLTSGGGPSDGLGSDFGFTAQLPAAANDVSIAVLCGGGNLNIILQGMNATGTVVAQTSGFELNQAFYLEITSSQYNITSFVISENGGFEGYDNVSYTYLPEPSILPFLSLAAISIIRRK